MKKKSHLDKKLARLAAVQATFQSHLRGQSLLAVANEFKAQGFSMVLDTQDVSVLSTAFFDELLTGLNSQQAQIDDMITLNLADGWTIDRIDSVSRALLQVGLYELLYNPDTPAIVVVSEYTDMAHAFFDEKDAGFVNGLLNKIARMARKADFEECP
jgi:N utilization substance protein B